MIWWITFSFQPFQNFKWEFLNGKKCKRNRKYPKIHQRTRESEITCSRNHKRKQNASPVYPLLQSILLYLKARFVKTCSPRPHPTQATPPSRPRPSLVVWRESKVLVADPEVFRKRTHEPRGNAMKKKKKKQQAQLRVYIQKKNNCTKVYNMLNQNNHLRMLQHTSQMNRNHLRLDLERLKQFIKSYIMPNITILESNVIFRKQD